MLIHNNFFKYNLLNQSHKNITPLSSNLGSFPTTKFQINQLYHFQARRGMKNEAEKTIKLLVNASKSYLVGTFNLRKAMFNNINFNHSNVLKITKEMQKVVEQSHFLSFSSKNNIIQAIANFYVFWEKGYIINLGNQWQVTRLVQQKDLGLEGTNRMRFGKSEVFFF